MSLEVKINQRTARVELLKWEGSYVNIKVDGKEYILDFEKVSKGVFSVLHDHKSFNIELVPGGNVKNYTVHTINRTYEVEIIDAEAKYRASRLNGLNEEKGNHIIAPIPGKVVRILVQPEDQIKAGQTLIVLSAMKMESEFKAPKDGTIKEIRVNEGDTVEARKVMMVIE